jgi:hypothetical protein
MSSHYIRDRFFPGGAEYNATARAADSAAATNASMDDMLALAMAPDEASRRALAQQIYTRRSTEQRQARTGRWIGRIITLTLLVSVGSFVYVEGTTPDAPVAPYVSPEGPVTAPDAPVAPYVSPEGPVLAPSAPVLHDDVTPAPTARLDAAPDDSDPAVVEQRGLQALSDAGLSNDEIYGNTN